jgi:hypothetical protein
MINADQGALSKESYMFFTTGKKNSYMQHKWIERDRVNA